ncbi:MAG: excinuclease ABC subunit C [Chitinophagaceae bacterium]|nr:excinuclease ABC subunit C [Chitinophagaceae bacterium]
MTQEEFQKLAPSIPQQPGIYKYFDADGKLLYVGKAKHLRKRVASYFNKTVSSYKTAELVRRIASIDYMIVTSEQDAFFLENSLIKKFQPVFNINLKDDKSYPFIVIKKEPYPRVFLTRRKIKDGSTYLGPFTSVAKVRELIQFIRQNIPLRNCKLNLTETNIQKKKFKVCLEYHLGNCKGPCEGLQNQQDYEEGLKQVKNLLSGNLKPVLQHLKQEMKAQVAEMKFEKAEVIRKKIEHLEHYQARSTVVNPKLGNADVYSIIRHENKAFINCLMVEHGNIIQTENLQVDCKLDETPQEVLEFMIGYISEKFERRPAELILPFEIERLDDEVTITVPKAGAKKQLLELSERNAAHFFRDYQQKQLLQLHKSAAPKGIALLQQLQADLQLQELPQHIECFDNSNFQGSFPVSAMVCFKNGEPSKKDYRHFNIKTVTGINDFASMKEVVYRRYKRLLEEQAPLPQLVIIDGGKGQLSAAMESIKELNLQTQLTVVGLAKNIEEVFFTGDTQSVKLPYDGASLKLLRRIRDEVHRFGITFHRNKRSKGTFKNELESIPGIGKVTADVLLNHFRSVANVKKASEIELVNLIGAKKADTLIKAFKEYE